MWYKAHRYLSNIHSNLLFYLQTETYVSRPLQTPSLPVSPYYHTDLLLQHFSHTILAFSLSLFPPFLSVFIRLYHLLPSVSQTLPPDLPVNAPTFTLSHCPPPPPRSDSCVSVCDAACASGTTASSHLKHFRETHICCFRAQRDMPWQWAV